MREFLQRNNLIPARPFIRSVGPVVVSAVGRTDESAGRTDESAGLVIASSLVRLPTQVERLLRLRVMREELGQSIVEFALSLPLLTFLLIGGSDIARGYAIQLAVQNGARAGAEAAAIDRTPTAPEAQERALDEMARTPGLDPTAAVVTMTLTDSVGAACTVSTIVNPCYATVRVLYTFRTIIPWPLIPNTFSLDRSTTMRRFY